MADDVVLARLAQLEEVVRKAGDALARLREVNARLGLEVEAPDELRLLEEMRVDQLERDDPVLALGAVDDAHPAAPEHLEDLPPPEAGPGQDLGAGEAVAASGAGGPLGQRRTRVHAHPRVRRVRKAEFRFPIGTPGGVR